MKKNLFSSCLTAGFFQVGNPLIEGMLVALGALAIAKGKRYAIIKHAVVPYSDDYY